MKEIMFDLRNIYSALLKLDVSRIDIFYLLIFTIIASLSSLMQPFFIGKIIDSITHRTKKDLFIYFCAILLVFLVSILALYLKNKKSIKIVSNVEISVKRKIFSEVLESEYGQFRKHNKGKLINIIHEDSMTFSNTLSFLLDIIIDILGFFISFFIILLISPTLSVLVIIIFPLMLYIYYIAGKRLKKLQIELKQWYDKYMNFMNESFQNFKLIKVYNLEKNRTHAFSHVLSKVYRVGVSRVLTETFSEMGIQSLLFISQMAVLSLGAILIFSNHLTIGMLVSFNSYSTNFKNSTTNLTSLNSTIQSVMVSFNRILELNNYSENKKQFPAPTNDISSITKIKIEDLNFQTDNKAILENINVEFIPGKINLISGESGSGKTTLFYILSNLENNYTGNIVFNNTNINDIPNNIFRKKLCFVTQSSELFSASIWENLTYGCEGQDKETVINICKKLEIHDFISSLPDGYESPIENYGDNISGGQAQRISIARAILHDADVYIFDEITSSLDKDNSLRVINCISDLIDNKIVIMSSHQDIKSLKVKPILEL